MTCKRTFRVLVALPLDSAAGRKKLNGIHRFLSEGYDWDMELLRNKGDFTAEAISAAVRSRFDGMLVGVPERREHRELHVGAEIPTVFIDRSDANTLESLHLCVFIHDDTGEIARAAAQHLLSCPGVRTFAFVPSRVKSIWSSTRQTAFAAALRARGNSLATYIGPGDSREALGAWIQRLEKPAAILAALDDRAQDVLNACRARGLRVPEDVSVLGIGNDEPICEMSVPALSSVAVDFEREGYLAARELQAMMLQRHAPTKRVMLIGVRDVAVRASTSAMKTPAALVRRAVEFIDRHALDGITSADVVAHLRVSRSLADLRFREVTGKSILEIILAHRLDEVKRLLRNTDLQISEIATRCGYRDANYLKNLFKSRVGMPMREYRRRNAHGG